MFRIIDRQSEAFPTRLVRWAVAVALLAAAGTAPAQCVSLATLGAASTQSFNTLSNTAGSTDNTLTITGWFLTETGSGTRDNEQYAVDTGSSNTGDTYSYGAAGSADRALGALQSGTLIASIGACFTNNTGSTISGLDIAYTGEQWRIGNTAAARDDRLDFQYSLNATSLDTGAWTDVDPLDFTNPVKTAGVAGALDGNAAANRTAISHSITGLSIANGTTFWIRWNDFNASGADDGLAIDDFSLTPQGGGGPLLPTLGINDVSLAEGNAGTTSFSFVVSLTAPAGPGGVTFDIATADGTAVAPGDYTARSLTGQTIPAGSSSYAFTVLVNGDTATEPDETFFVNVTNITGANAGDPQGVGTILNDDVTLTPIHDIQGPGASSPIIGSNVTTRGIVTGVRSNGFYIQEPDATVDADPATSEGIYVFTSSAPPAAAVVGNLVQVTGTVAEYVPAQDPFQPPLTEIISPTVTMISSGNPLPTPVPLSPTFPDPSGPHDQLERLEGMRVSIASLTVTGPTQGSSNEPNASATSNGVFYGVITGQQRPFREPGIQAPDPAPAGSTIPPLPRWDSNPELLRIDSDGLIGAPLIDVSTGAIVTGIAGPLDYAFRRYTVLPDPATTPAVTGGMSPVAATPPSSSDFTVASYNLQRFFDTVDDPSISEPVLTAVAYDRRLSKASLAIRDYLHFPDIIGVEEVENLGALQDLAARINADANAASQPDPQYVAYLVEGNDPGGVDIGYLVKTAEVAASTPRVQVVSVTQENAGELMANPDSTTSLLNDRPPLVLEAVVHRSDLQSIPVTVILNHLRSLNDVASEEAGSSGWPTLGARVRDKRKRQAQSLAGLVQARQTANPAENLIVLGDFNAFEFNDGLVDVMGTIAGTPSPDDQTAVPDDGVDMVSPDLVNLLATRPSSERYSYVYDGNAQSIDHVLVNGALVAATVAQRIEHARINTDFPLAMRNQPGVLRLADHDPVLAYFTLAAVADVTADKTAGADPVDAGDDVSYSIVIGNDGPDTAPNPNWNDVLPAGTTFVSLSAPAGWSCTTPAVGATGTVSCTAASLPVGSATFTLVVNVDGAFSGTLDNSVTVASDASDPDAGNGTSTASIAVLPVADLSVTISDAPDPVAPGAQLEYTIVVDNAGAGTATDVLLSDTLPAGTVFSALTTPAGWSCTTPAVGAAGTVECTIASLAPGSAGFVLSVTLDGATVPGSTLSNSATVGATSTDPDISNNSATATTAVATPSMDLSVEKTAPSAVEPGGSLSYGLAVVNPGPANAADVVLLDTLPAGTTFTSLGAPAGWTCTTPAVGAGGTVECSIASLLPGTSTFTLVVQVDAGSTGTIENTASVSTSSNDPDLLNNTASATTGVSVVLADVAVTKTAPTTVNAGANLSYTLGVANAGPAAASNVVLADTLPPGTSFVALSPPGGWSCTTPAVGAGGAVNCSVASLPVGSASFTLTVQVAAGATGTITNTATVTSSTDPDVSNDSASASTTVSVPPVVSGSKSVSGSRAPGGSLSYSIVLTNIGGSTQADNPGDEFTDVLPPDLTLVSATASSGTVVANTGSNTVTWNGSISAGGSVTITIQATLRGDAAIGSVVTNQGMISYDGNGDGSNESSAVTDDPSTAVAGDGTSFTVVAGAVVPATPVLVPSSSTLAQLLLVAMLALLGTIGVARRIH